MSEKKRRKWMSAELKAELWRRWKQGEPVSQICTVLGMGHSKVWMALRSNGGYVPRPRKRSSRVLGMGEREEISRGLASGESMRQIAKRLRRSPSTVSREIARHGGIGRYRAAVADRRAWKRATRPKLCKLRKNGMLQQEVAARLALYWSPEQISGWLKSEFPHNADMQISPETIYRTLFIQARGALKKALIGQLRSRRPMRRTGKKPNKGPALAATEPISIRQRPAEAEDR